MRNGKGPAFYEKNRGQEKGKAFYPALFCYLYDKLYYPYQLRSDHIGDPESNGHFKKSAFHVPYRKLYYLPYNETFVKAYRFYLNVITYMFMKQMRK
jgi:hypothetical protein